MRARSLWVLSVAGAFSSWFGRMGISAGAEGRSHCHLHSYPLSPKPLSWCILSKQEPTLATLPKLTSHFLMGLQRKLQVHQSLMRQMVIELLFKVLYYWSIRNVIKTSDHTNADDVVALNWKIEN